MRGISARLAVLVLLAGFGCGDDGASGADASLPPDAGPTCEPRTCDAPFTYCGDVSDGCGGMLACGECPAPLECGARQPGVCGVAEASRVCSETGWCWEHPLPFGMDFEAIWGAASGDLWVAGAGGTLLRGDGASWQSMASGTDDGIKAIWGAGADDVWLAGRDGYLRRWNGAALTTPPGAPTTLYAEDVHGSAADDVWIVGSFGQFDIYRFDGESWTGYEHDQFSGLDGVWAASPTQAWAVGFGDSQLRFDGEAWLYERDMPETNRDVWGTVASDVWVAGREGVHHWDGAGWTTLVDARYLNAIDGTSGSDVWAGGESGLHHFDGEAWTSFPVDVFVNGLWAAAPGQAWAAGQSGRLWSWDGTSWTRRTGFGVARSFEDVWVGDGEVWLIGSGAMRWKDGALEDRGELFRIAWYDIAGVWGTSATDLWAAGPLGQFAHWDGSDWTVTQPIDGLPSVNAIWGAAADDIYAVTDAVDPFRPSDAYVVHWDGVSWSISQSIRPSADSDSGLDLDAIGGTGPDDVWVAGEDGTLWHFDGASWTDQSGAVAFDINDIWASPEGTVWLATDGGLYRRSGAGWTAVGGLDEPAGTVTGTSDGDVWVALGDRLNPSPLVAHWDGTSWTRENTGAGQPIRRLAVTPDGIFAAGRSGAILRKAR